MIGGGGGQGGGQSPARGWQGQTQRSLAECTFRNTVVSFVDCYSTCECVALGVPRSTLTELSALSSHKQGA